FIFLIHETIAAKGYFGFDVDFNNSGLEFRERVQNYSRKISNETYANHLLPFDKFPFITSAFYFPSDAKLRASLMLRELSTRLCFMNPFYLPVYYVFNAHRESTRVTGFMAWPHPRLREVLVETLLRHGMLPFPLEERADFQSEHDSPNRVIVGRFPIHKDWIPMEYGFLTSPISLKPQIAIYWCEKGWIEECEKLDEIKIRAPCDVA
ncbi:hypothetical protein PFISCL1PPCAC_665, partial [Pristionchus fissidentatus]